MRFQKLSNNSIRCIISQEEMDEKGLGIDDLMDNREKAEDFLRYILQEARYAVDFRTNGNVLNVQLSIMPDGDVSMMISDDEDSAIRNMIAEMRNHLAAFKTAPTENKNQEPKGDTLDQDQDPFLFGMSKEPLHREEAPEEKKDSTIFHAAENESGQQEVEDADDIIDLPIWAQMDSLEDCIRLSLKLPEVRDCKSDLYRYDGQYFITIELHMTRKELAGVAFKVAEYSNGMYASVPGVAEIVEHGALLRKGHALKDLAELA